MHIFPPIGKKYAYFPPNLLKYTKLQKKKKGRQFLACASHLLIVIHFSWGKNIYQEGGGGVKNINFKFNIHPCNVSQYV